MEDFGTESEYYNERDDRTSDEYRCSSCKNKRSDCECPSYTIDDAY